MRKTSVLIITIVTVIIAILLSRSYLNNHTSRERIALKITNVANNLLVKTFPTIRIEETMVRPSEDYVNFVYDKLYKVEVVYERNQKFKKIVFNIGVYKNRFLVPPESKLLQLDKDASVIAEK